MSNRPRSLLPAGDRDASFDLAPAPAHLVAVLSRLAADLVERRGALSLTKHIAGWGDDADDVICATIRELRARGRDGLASQVAALRYAADELPAKRAS